MKKNKSLNIIIYAIIFFMFTCSMLSSQNVDQELEILKPREQYEGGMKDFLDDFQEYFGNVDTNLIPQINSPCFLRFWATFDENNCLQNIEISPSSYTRGDYNCNEYLVSLMYRAVFETKDKWKPYFKDGKRKPYVGYFNYSFQWYR